MEIYSYRCRLLPWGKIERSYRHHTISDQVTEDVLGVGGVGEDDFMLALPHRSDLMIAITVNGATGMDEDEANIRAVIGEGQLD